MKKVLIIEDDPIVAGLYKTRLEREGYEIEIAADGQTGFYRIHELKPDAVLLDLMLPKINGIGILKKIRAQSEFKSTPLIVFTNAYLSNTVSDCFAAGATLVFNKAATRPKELIDALRNSIQDAPLAAPSAPSNNPPALVDQVSLPEKSTEASFQSTAPAEARTKAPLSAPTETREENAVDDGEFQAELLKSFLESTPEAVASIRKTTQDFSRASDEASRSSLLESLYRKVHALTGGAGMAGLSNLSKTACALEFLLQELHEKPKNLNTSTLRTIVNAIDVLAELCAQGTEGDVIEQSALEILVVDDEILSRRAITYALGKAGLKSTSVEDSEVALNLAAEKSFSLIFLDVQLAGMDGFELCRRIRLLPLNKDTPVILVTTLTDLKSRAKSSLSGTCDLIAKPFMFIELTVKALTYIWRRPPAGAASAVRTG